MCRIVYMGTPDIAAVILERLIQEPYEIVLAVTQPDRPKGRGHEMAFSPVKETALKYGIPVFQPEKLRNPEAVAEIEKAKPDMIVVAAFGQILPKSVLSLPKYGCINVHASLLPAYRGAAPIQWAILDGKKETGVTIMYMNEGLDTGDVELAILENVGNLVCPAEFDTGASKNAMILSVPEGEDKPLKYPLMFSICDVVLINKIDVLPYFDFDMEKCKENILFRNLILQIEATKSM